MYWLLPWPMQKGVNNMSLETIRRHLKAKQQAAEPEPAGSLDAALDALVKKRVEQALAEQDQPRRRNRHLPTFDQGQGFDSSPPPTPASAPIERPPFSAVFERDERGRTIAVTVAGLGRLVVQRRHDGKAVSVRRAEDAHEPLPLQGHSKDD